MTPVITTAKPAITITVPYFMSAKKKSTTFSALSVKGVPAGATVKVTCKGTCPKKSVTIDEHEGRHSGAQGVPQKALKVGTTLTIEVTKPGDDRHGQDHQDPGLESGRA